MEGCAGTLGSESAPDAGGAMADESSGDLALVSLGTGEFTSAFAAPKLAGRTSRALLKFEVGSAPAGLFAASGAEAVAVEVALEPVWF